MEKEHYFEKNSNTSPSILKTAPSDETFNSGFYILLYKKKQVVS